MAAVRIRTSLSSCGQCCCRVGMDCQILNWSFNVMIGYRFVIFSGFPRTFQILVPSGKREIGYKKKALSQKSGMSYNAKWIRKDTRLKKESFKTGHLSRQN